MPTRPNETREEMLMRRFGKPFKSTNGQTTQVIGSAHPSSKVTEADVKAIREAFKAGERRIDLAKRYNIRYATIRQIVNNETWKHVKC